MACHLGLSSEGSCALWEGDEGEIIGRSSKYKYKWKEQNLQLYYWCTYQSCLEKETNYARLVGFFPVKCSHSIKALLVLGTFYVQMLALKTLGTVFIVCCQKMKGNYNVFVFVCVSKKSQTTGKLT